MLKSIAWVLLVALLAPWAVAEETQGPPDVYLDYFHADPGTLPAEYQTTLDAALVRMDAEDYAGASDLLGQLLEETEPLELEPPIRARLLVNQGILQALSGRPSAALLTLREAIERIERSRGPFAPMLVEVLTVHGVIGRHLESFDGAEDSLRRAQHIAHRHGGVYTEAQLPVLDELSALYLDRRLPLFADREQWLKLEVHERGHGPESEDLVPGLMELAQYFAQRGDTVPLIALNVDPEQSEAYSNRYRSFLFDASISLYERAIRILEQKHGPDDLLLVEPLKGLADAQLLRGSDKHAESAMERATAIVTDSTGTDIPDRARALVELGDLYTLTGDARSDQAYLDAWNLLSGRPEYDNVREELFGAPVRLYPKTIRTIVLKRRPDNTRDEDQLFADIQFSVADSGQVSDIRILDGNIPQRERNILLHYLEKAIFRPRIVDGRFVDTRGVIMQQPYKVIGPAG